MEAVPHSEIYLWDHTDIHRFTMPLKNQRPLPLLDILMCSTTCNSAFTLLNRIHLWTNFDVRRVPERCRFMRNRHWRYCWEHVESRSCRSHILQWGCFIYSRFDTFILQRSFSSMPDLTVHCHTSFDSQAGRARVIRYSKWRRTRTVRLIRAGGIRVGWNIGEIEIKKNETNVESVHWSQNFYEQMGSWLGKPYA